jgi:cytochrome P450
MQNPDQLALLKRDPSLMPQAVNELVRYATPVLHMRRTATKDTELNGKQIAKDDKVVMWYASANFDESVFPDPLKFDITRPVRPEHTSFGSFGIHHCLGAPLARLEVRILLEQLINRNISIEQLGAPVRMRSNFVNGVLSLPCRFTANR